MCMEGYYDGTIFHRIIKDYLVQGGDPSGTGEGVISACRVLSLSNPDRFLSGWSGSESSYGELFKDEFHTRLKFTHRLVLILSSPLYGIPSGRLVASPLSPQGSGRLCQPEQAQHQWISVLHHPVRRPSECSMLDGFHQLLILLLLLREKTEWLDRQNTIFGKVVGDTIYNLLRIGECAVSSFLL